MVLLLQSLLSTQPAGLQNSNNPHPSLSLCTCIHLFISQQSNAAALTQKSLCVKSRRCGCMMGNSEGIGKGPKQIFCIGRDPCSLWAPLYRHRSYSIIRMYFFLRSAKSYTSGTSKEKVNENIATSSPIPPYLLHLFYWNPFPLSSQLSSCFPFFFQKANICNDELPMYTIITLYSSMM